MVTMILCKPYECFTIQDSCLTLSYGSCGPLQEQYVFIHDAIKESLECGNTEILAKDLPQALQRLHQPSLTDDTVTSIEAEFRVRHCALTVVTFDPRL